MKESYLHAVRVLLDCPPKERDRLLARLDSAVTAYLEDVPEAKEADLIANFGTPGDCAARFLEECSFMETLAERQKKGLRRRIFTAVLAAFLLIAIGFTLYLWSHHWIFKIRMDG